MCISSIKNAHIRNPVSFVSCKWASSFGPSSQASVSNPDLHTNISTAQISELKYDRILAVGDGGFEVWLLKVEKNRISSIFRLTGMLTGNSRENIRKSVIVILEVKIWGGETWQEWVLVKSQCVWQLGLSTERFYDQNLVFSLKHSYDWNIIKTIVM